MVWSNTTPFPWIITDNNGKTVFIIDSDGAHIIGRNGWSINETVDPGGAPIIFFTDPLNLNVGQMTVNGNEVLLSSYPAGSLNWIGSSLQLYSNGQASLQGSDGTNTLGPGLFFDGNRAFFGVTNLEPNPIVYNKNTKYMERGNNPAGGPSGWQSLTLLNGWIPRPAFHVPGYKIGIDGRVHLRGMAQGGTVNTTIATLPAGVRPIANVQPPITTDVLGAGSPRITINTSTGNMDCIGMGATATLVGLDVSSFDLT